MNQRARIEAMLLLVALLLTGGAGWWLKLQPMIDVDPAGFEALPHELNDWDSVDLEIDEGVAALLRADHHIQRAYHHRQGYTVFVYVGYYGTKRGGSPEHTPDVCYPSQGWKIIHDDEVRLGGPSGALSIREFRVQKENQVRLVHFWYRTQRDSGYTSRLPLQLRQFWDRLTTNRGDGALVRLSTPVLEGDFQSARLRLFGLDAALESALDRVWPGPATEVAAR